MYAIHWQSAHSKTSCINNWPVISHDVLCTIRVDVVVHRGLVLLRRLKEDLWWRQWVVTTEVHPQPANGNFFLKSVHGIVSTPLTVMCIMGIAAEAQEHRLSMT
jgi:hypothetical protein